MINKPVKFTFPLEEKEVIALDNFLSDVGRNAGRIVQGSYVGDGTSSKSITIGFFPQLIIISKKANLGTATFPLAGNMVFTMSANSGVSYIPGTGFVKDAVLSFNNLVMVLGSNASVNSAGTDFIYFAIG